MGNFVNIALPIPMKRLFTYHTEEDSVLVGVRALVPFGKKILTGIIVETNVAERDDAKPILELLDNNPVFSKKMLELTKWISDYYYASWGETLYAALPQGMSPQSVITVRIAKNIDDDDVSVMAKKAPRRAELLQLLRNHKGPLSVSYLQQQLNMDSVTSQLEALELDGTIEITRGIENAIQAKKQKAITISFSLLQNNEEFHNILNHLDSNAPKQSLLLSSLYLHAMHNRPHVLLQEILKETRTSSSAADSLVEKGYATYLEVEVQRTAEHSATNALAQGDESELPLTEEQAHAVRYIDSAITDKQSKTFLLHGVTGSGKTLVYLHAIKKTLAEQRTALMLVPEISLTPQLIDRFRSTFGDAVTVLHSKMSGGERYDAWRAIQRGDVQLVLGVRSALFAPLHNVGLIIVDEEHEHSYKQESPSPRYNARDCSVIRGIIENAVIVLGSATPSLESMYNAQTGKYHLLEIESRADGATLPDIQVVDMLEERKMKKVKSGFSSILLEHIKDRIVKKEGVILLQNRRGFAPHLECEDCGNVPQCYQCNVSLTYHKYSNQLRCHYCGWSKLAVKSCEVCGNAEMSIIGSGTQRIEEDLQQVLEQENKKAVIQRVDQDTTSKRGEMRKILEKFTNGDIDILVGTQMIAKGLNIPRVTLVGVINADLQLHIPDFRSGERTYQLLTQVAGRAGRDKSKRGEVLIQTNQPKHQAIISAKLGKYDIFYNDELQQRRDAQYPPFTRFVMIEFTGKNQELVHQHAHIFASYLPKNSKAVLVLGPSKPNIDKIRGLFRRMIIVKGVKSEDSTGNALRHALNVAYSHYFQTDAVSTVRVIIDIDSYSAL
ncbi:MAG: primosomal protein N' [Candidatus Kapaibacterium sp.]